MEDPQQNDGKKLTDQLTSVDKNNGMKGTDTKESLKLEDPESKIRQNRENPGPPTRFLKWQKRMRYQPENVKFTQSEGLRHEYFKNMVGPESQSEVEIPRAICVADRVEASAKEMQAMLKAVKQHTNNKAILQWLPRHMRRRAASHNRKRLPRRLHAKAAELAAQAQGNANKAAKPISRRKRRRIRNLQNEYAKRAGKQGWLETHMWHAKRFHMTESNDPKYKTWRNRVALCPNDKSFRACYRAVSKHCLIQDISYMRCLQLTGGTDELLGLLQKVCEDVNFDSLVLGGQREVSCILYKLAQTGDGQLTKNQNDQRQLIGPASILWRPRTKCQSSDVLIWIHPTSLSSVMETLSSVCKSDMLKVKIRDVSEEFLRFRLTGPKSSITLMSVLRPIQEYPTCGEEDEKSGFRKWMCENRTLVSSLHGDFTRVMTDCHRRLFAKPDSYVPKDDVPDYFDGSVFPVITDDPRLTLPLDKTTPTFTSTKNNYPESGREYEESTSTDITLCDSPIWDEKIREEVSQSRVPDHVVSTRRRHQKYEMGEQQQEKWRLSLSTAVPIIVIRKSPNSERKLEAKFQLEAMQESASSTSKGTHSGPPVDFASGWDVILPHGWGTAFWIPFIYHRVRAGGLRESRNISLECLKPHFPEDFPDTEAGRDSWCAEANKLANKYYRKPPAKRPNYCVLGVPNPFQPNWNTVIAEKVTVASLEDEVKKITAKSLKRPAGGTNECEVESKKQKLCKAEGGLTERIEESSVIRASDYDDMNNAHKQVFVIRDMETLASIRHCINSTLESSCLPENDGDSSFPVVTALLDQSAYLVCVSVKSLNKGIPTSRSMICAPTIDDLADFCKEITDPYKYGLQSVAGPTETKHWDPYRKERKEAKKNTGKRKKKKKDKETLVVSSDITESTKVAGTNPAEQAPNQPQMFSVSPSRDTIGFITSGDFLFSCACGAGLGFVSLEKLYNLAKQQSGHKGMEKLFQNEAVKDVLCAGGPEIPLLALARNVDSIQYRFVKIALIKPC